MGKSHDDYTSTAASRHQAAVWLGRGHDQFGHTHLLSHKVSFERNWGVKSKFVSGELIWSLNDNPDNYQLELVVSGPNTHITKGTQEILETGIPGWLTAYIEACGNAGNEESTSGVVTIHKAGAHVKEVRRALQAVQDELITTAVGVVEETTGPMGQRHGLLTRIANLFKN